MTVATRKFNPGFLTEDELVASFCVRTHEFKSIVETLRGCTGNSSQHQIVIGPRGSGKTTLLLRVAAEIGRDAELSQRFLPVPFAEESYEVSTGGEFWLECLSQLAEQAPSEEDGPDLRRTCKELRTIQDDRTLADRCLGTLLDFSDRQGKRLVLLVENLNMMFRDMVDPDAGWRLRHTLQTESRIVLLASATSRFDEIDQPDSALYELLRVHSLAPLDTEECTTLWEAASGESASRQEVRPLEILTGGSPRLLAIVARLGAGRSLGDLLDHLLDLIDDHTEYFKSHIEALPAQERRVYLALAELWEPATTKEVADRARLDTNKCSAQLKRLSDRGAVRVVGGTSRRKQFYLTERLYNIYYLLRRHRGPERVVKALLQFMAAYYAPLDVLRLVAGFLRSAARPGPQGIRARDLLPTVLRESSRLPELRDSPNRPCFPEDAAILQATAFMTDLARLLLEASHEEALAACDDLSVEVATGTTLGQRLSFLALQIVRGALLRSIGRAAEALDVLDVALEQAERDGEYQLDALVPQLLRNKSGALAATGRTEEALALLDNLDRRFSDREERTTKQDVAGALLDKASLLINADRLEEALSECSALVGRFGSEADPELEDLVMRAITWRAMLFANTSRLEDSLEEFDSLEKRLRGRDLAEVDEGIPKALLLKGTILTALGRPDAARRLYDYLLKGTEVPGPAKTLKAHVQLAQAQLELDSHNYGMAAKAASCVLGDRRHQPADIRCRALLIRVQASASAAPAASSKDLAVALDLLPTLDRFPQEVLSALTTASLDLGVAHVLELIERSSSCDLLLPFKTALDIDLGKAPRVAREVEEVAKDIRRKLAELRCRRATNTQKSSESEAVS
jgi:tetratricopeptide (TPR) repeat protein